MVVGFECASVCCCGPGMVSVTSVVQVLSECESARDNYSGLSGALHMGTHILLAMVIISMASCMGAGDSLWPPLLLLLS